MTYSKSAFCAGAIAILCLATFLSSFGPAAVAGLANFAGLGLSASDGLSDRHLSKSKSSSPKAPTAKFEAPKAPRTTPERQDGRPQEFSSTRSGTAASGGGKSCKSCRSACYKRWRTNCGYTSSCKKKYASCMRDCAQQC